MLQLQTFTFNAFQENTYLIINEHKDCWIVDPGMYDSSETNQLFDFISSNSLTPKAIINTHAHLDHIFAKLDVSSRTAVATFALRHGLV